MKKNLLICTLAAVLAVGGFLATRTAAANSPAAPAPARFWQRLADKLNLSADQRTQIKAVFQGEKATLAPLLTTLHDAHKDLRFAIRAGDATEASVRAAAATVGAAEADLAVERMKIYGKIAPILTEAQRQQLAGLQTRADEFVDHLIARLGSGLDD